MNNHYNVDMIETTTDRDVLERFILVAANAAKWGELICRKITFPFFKN